MKLWISSRKEKQARKVLPELRSTLISQSVGYTRCSPRCSPCPRQSLHASRSRPFRPLRRGSLRSAGPDRRHPEHDGKWDLFSSLGNYNFVICTTFLLFLFFERSSFLLKPSSALLTSTTDVRCRIRKTTIQVSKNWAKIPLSNWKAICLKCQFSGCEKMAGSCAPLKYWLALRFHLPPSVSSLLISL